MPPIEPDHTYTAFEQLIQFIVQFVHDFGYLGIFIMTFLESTFVPIPSEITMVPAGYLVQQGKMNVLLVMIFSTTGTVGGALFNYYLAIHYGRALLLRFGKFFLMDEKKLSKIESFFEEHGAISTFTGRLIPGVRHYISFPAGLAKMNLKRFTIYTALGGSIWMAVLTAVGYYIGENETLVKQWMPYIVGKVVMFGAVAVVLYIFIKKRFFKPVK